MNPLFPLHMRVPYHHAGTQSIGIMVELVRPLPQQQQLPNPTLALIDKLSLSKSDAQQRRHMIMIRF